MGDSGAVASEDSTGPRTRRGGITKTGNAHLRRVVIEAAWAYRYRPAVGDALRKRQACLTPEVKAIAWKAQHRLHGRYCWLTAKGKCKQEGGDRGGTRTIRVHLGNRRTRGSQSTPGIVRGRIAQRGDVAAMQHRVRSIGGGRGAHGKENPRLIYAASLWARPALLVRGSSRRITIMRFRPANIRVINRRDSASATSDAAYSRAETAMKKRSETTS